MDPAVVKNSICCLKPKQVASDSALSFPPYMESVTKPQEGAAPSVSALFSFPTLPTLSLVWSSHTWMTAAAPGLVLLTLWLHRWEGAERRREGDWQGKDVNHMRLAQRWFWGMVSSSI